MKLDELRREIDGIDGKLCRLFCERMDVSRRIGEYKRENALPVSDRAREKSKLSQICGSCPDEYREAAEKLYARIFSLSRGAQTKCGLLGERLGHSYSPIIHAYLADYEYRLYEKKPGEVEDFVKNGSWDGLNVTMPYKKTVMPMCTELSERAKHVGCVNAMIKRPDGSIYGDNTDAGGFEKLIKKLGAEPEGKKTVVFGSGGASAAVCAVLRDMKVRELRVISRSGEDNYENLSRNYDAEIVVNATPLGMFPNNGKAAADLRNFTRCEAAADVVYNPLRTAFIMQAEELGIPCAGGLYMLAAQAVESAKLFSGEDIPESRTEDVTDMLTRKIKNIVLIGMPGCGKSSAAAELGRLTGRQVLDSDEIIAGKAGMSIEEIFRRHGEDYFRKLETETLAELGKRSGIIISAGGGAVTRRENYPLLHQNSEIVLLERDIASLARDGRPLSKDRDLSELYTERREMYSAFADMTVRNDGSIENTAERIMNSIK